MVLCRPPWPTAEGKWTRLSSDRAIRCQRTACPRHAVPNRVVPPTFRTVRSGPASAAVVRAPSASSLNGSVRPSSISAGVLRLCPAIRLRPKSGCHDVRPRRGACVPSPPHQARLVRTCGAGIRPRTGQADPRSNTVIARDAADRHQAYSDPPPPPSPPAGVATAHRTQGRCGAPRPRHSAQSCPISGSRPPRCRATRRPTPLGQRAAVGSAP